MAEWFEKQAFWKTLYPFMFPEGRFAKATEEIEKVLALAGVEGGKVLDLCCGPGRHSVELARRGFAVTGVDRTKFLLAKARQHAKREGAQVEWVESDMRAFKRPRAFDLAVNLFTSFGYFDKDGEDRHVLKNLHTSLKPGGVLVMDMAGKEWIARHFTPSGCDEAADGALLVQRREIRHNFTRAWNQWIVIRDGKTKSFEFEHTIYSALELNDLLKSAGFKNVQIFGSLDGAEYGVQAKRLVAVARKPKHG